MAFHTPRFATSRLLNGSMCLAVWLGSATAQEIEAERPVESRHSIAITESGATPEIDLAALYQKQGKYAQAELIYRQALARIETADLGDLRVADILRRLGRVNIDLGNYHNAETA